MSQTQAGGPEQLIFAKNQVSNMEGKQFYKSLAENHNILQFLSV